MKSKMLTANQHDWARYCYCYANGEIHFGPTLPKGVLPIDRLTDRTKRAQWEYMISEFCRRAYDGTALVTGIPEAVGQEAAIAALNRFRTLVATAKEKL